MEETRNYNREKENKEQLTIADNLDNTTENSFEQLGTHKRMNEMVDFSGGLLGI